MRQPWVSESPQRRGLAAIFGTVIGWTLLAIVFAVVVVVGVWVVRTLVEVLL